MKVKQFVVLVVAMSETLAVAQEFPLGIRAQALGGASVAQGRDAEAMFDNPATLTRLAGSTFTAFYAHPFGLKELRLSSFSANTHYRRLAFGAAVVDLGHALYRDRRYHLGLAKNFLSNQRLALGVSSALRHLRISGYGDDAALQLDFGTQLRLSEALVLGTAFHNILEATMGVQNEKLPRSVCFGFAYAPTSNLTLQMDLYKQNNFPEEWRIGIETNPWAPLLLRIGTATNPDRLTFGFALRLLKVSLQFAAYSHTDLGWTEQFAVTLKSK